MASTTSLSVRKSTTHMLRPDDIEVRPQLNGRWKDLARPDRLIDSLLSLGQIQAVVLRPNPENGNPLLVAGFRRILAAKTITKEKLGGYSPDKPFLIECKLFPVKTDEEALLLNIAENRDRESTSAIDDAHNMDRLHKDHGMKYEDIAKHYGMAVSSVSNRISLLTLAIPIQEAVHKGEMSPTAALQLVGSDDQTQAEALKLGAKTIDQVRQTAAKGSQTGQRRPGRKRSDPNARVKTLKDTRNLMARFSGSDNPMVSMLGGILTAWMDGKTSDSGVQRKVTKLLESAAEG